MSIQKAVASTIRMKSDPAAAALLAAARRTPFRSRALSWATRREGGQLTSLTLRSYLKSAHGVAVGAYSYGSLLEPGRSDRGLEIGRYVSIGPNVRRFGAAHPVDRLSMHPYWYNPMLRVVDEADDVERSSCVIDHDAWIGANVTILPGCRRIGIGAVVGAGTIVTKDVPDFAVVVGNPGRVRGTRLDDAARAELLQRQPWLLDPGPAAAMMQGIAADLDLLDLFAR